MFGALMVLAAAALADAPLRAPEGGGGIDAAQFRDEMTLQMRADIDAQIRRNLDDLHARGVLPPEALRARTSSQVLFDWPLRPSAAYTEPDYHGISNFVDLDPAFPDHRLDYNCGVRTYDLSGGYNHSGVDLFLWPYAWMLMDQGAIQIVAAAPGIIVGKVDGNDDRSCPDHFSADWNAVYIQHDDGSVAWYGHMRRNSPTTKDIGETVALGEYLGLVGSAGFSTGPHLHFELHSSLQPGYSIVEGYNGACHGVGSRYLSQRPYYQSRINRLSTNFAPPDFNAGCPNPGQETPNFKSAFNAGDWVYVVAYYHDQLPGQVTNFRLLRPDASVFDSWSQSYSGPPAFYPASYWYWSYALPANAPNGVWTFEATFQGATLSKTFTVGDALFNDGFE